MTVDITDRFSAIGQRSQGDPLAPLFGRIMAAQAADPSFISLAVGAPDNEVLPVAIAKQLFADVLDNYGGRALNYTKPDGLPPLVQMYLQRLAEEGLKFDPETQQLLVTSGGMEAISMASEMLLDPGDTVLVESPAFAGALGVFKLWGATVVHVECDEQGMVRDALATAIDQHKPKLVLLMPDGQNPGGCTMSLGRRQAIAKLLDERDVYAIEDGAYARLRFHNQQLPPLQALTTKVLYATSVSKYLFPAARLGVLIADKKLVSEAANMKSAYNMQASGFMQAVAERYMTPGGAMDEYVPGLVQEYAKRRDAMVAAVRKHFPASEGYEFVEPEGGMFLWLQGPTTVNFTELIDAAIANKVAYVPGSMFFDDKTKGHNAARLNFASTPVEKIDEAVRRLAEVTRAAA